MTKVFGRNGIRWVCPNPCFERPLSDAIIDSFVHNRRGGGKGIIGKIEDGGGGTWCVILLGEIVMLTKIFIESYYFKNRYRYDDKLERGRTDFDGRIFIYKSSCSGVMIAFFCLPPPSKPLFGYKRPTEIDFPSSEYMGKRCNGFYVFHTFGKYFPFSEVSCGTTEWGFGQNQNFGGAFDHRCH